MSPITTHVLDISVGSPAVGISVALERIDHDDARLIGRSVTDADGRVGGLLAEGARLDAGTYRLAFDTGAYFRAKGVRTFYPLVTIAFEVHEVEEHYHVPLLLSPHGYTTYRGS